MTSVSVKQALQMIDAHANDPHFKIIDVRSAQQFKTGHIKGSLLIPLNEIPQRYKQFELGFTYLMVCRSGRRSGSATHTINSHGFKAINMEGGMVAWAAEKYPIAM